MELYEENVLDVGSSVCYICFFPPHVNTILQNKATANMPSPTISAPPFGPINNK